MSNSPFGAKLEARAALPEKEVEFRSVVHEGARVFISLFDPATGISCWIEVGHGLPGIEVRRYDARAERIEVLVQGQPRTLSLKKARVESGTGPAILLQ